MSDVVSLERPVSPPPPRAAGAPATGGRMKNVGGMERGFSVLGGVVLTLLGLRRRTAGGLAAGAAGLALIHRGVTGYCAGYRAMGLSTAERGAGREEVRDRGYCAQKRLRIERPPDALYAFWREFTNLPRVMPLVERVSRNPDGTLHWVLGGPVHVAWDARTTEDRPDARIAWETLKGSEVHHVGAVEFRPAPGGGTDVVLSVAYAPPAGILGKAAAKLLGEDPARRIAEDLRRFKQIMEAGEIPRVEGQPRGQ
ncbi:MAG: SRPBCC family protein [Candidatus Methylomirabilales bacterium]